MSEAQKHKVHSPELKAKAGLEAVSEWQGPIREERSPERRPEVSR